MFVDIPLFLGQCIHRNVGENPNQGIAVLDCGKFELFWNSGKSKSIPENILNFTTTSAL
jgi:hypothetical protein